MYNPLTFPLFTFLIVSLKVRAGDTVVWVLFLICLDSVNTHSTAA